MGFQPVAEAAWLQKLAAEAAPTGSTHAHQREGPACAGPFLLSCEAASGRFPPHPERVPQAAEEAGFLDRVDQIGRAHVCTPVTNAHLVCRLLLETKKETIRYTGITQTGTTQACTKGT